MERLLVYSNADDPLFELFPGDVHGCTRTEELGGKHTLSLTTSQVLSYGHRIIKGDATGKWREYVVTSIDERHAEGLRAVGTYDCVWSLQYDLSGVTCNTMPGINTVGGVTAQTAAESLLTHTSRWTVGTVTSSNKASASFYGMQAWEALGKLCKTWGVEIDSEITVGATGVVSRALAVLSHVGSSEAVRRFDYGNDMTGISRKVSTSMYYARIIPLGKGEQILDAEGNPTGGYGRRITIEDVNGGVQYLENASAAEAMKLPDGNGGWEYPTRSVVNDSITTPEALLEWGLSVLNDYTVPKVTYSADVVQLARAGMDVHGIELGDECVCVDKGFGGEGLRVSGRIVKLSVNDLDRGGETAVTIGEVSATMADAFKVLGNRIEGVENNLNARASTTADYLEHILDNLNREINATGGYTYITDGQGIRTYDTAVSNPLVGAEASQVTELKGGTIRFANSRTGQGDWNWKTVIVSGHIATELVTAGHITAGYIGDPVSGDYWDLDNHTLRISGGSTVAGMSASSLVNQVEATITDVDVEFAENQSTSTAPTTGWSTTAPAWREGYYIWQRTKTTTAAGPSYSDPVCISGRDGEDGVSITSTTISYGTSSSASTQPSSWSSTAPTSIQKGKWVWVRTVYAYSDSTSKTIYSKSYAGTDGQDGTGVTILGSYDTYAQLVAAHPTGSAGDAYLVGGHLYVWSATASAWTDVGVIQGPAGANGTSVTVSAIEYAQGASGTSAPSSGWQSTVPNVAQGKWLWTRTTFSDGMTALNCAYMGTDGEDGNSVAVQSATKSGGITTVVLAGTDGSTTTLSIEDGSDGTNGTPGLNGYVHTAWANSADGSTDFSTSVSTGKSYLGVYTDNTAADSQSPSAYNWSKIEGATGPQGATGIGVSAVEEQYYLSTSNTTQTGGGWTTAQPTWESGKYIWTRTRVTWTNNTVTNTSPVLAKGINDANSRSLTASQTATQAQNAASAASTTATNALNAINGLDQVEIFNRLTNDGEEQGLFLSEGKLYVNADYMNTGAIGDLDSGNYWDLDTGEFTMASTANFGSTTVAGALQSIAAAQTSAYESNLIPFTGNMDTMHGWTSANTTLSGKESAVIAANTGSAIDWTHRIYTPEIALADIYDKEVTFSLDAVATGGTASLYVGANLYHQGSLSRFASRNITTLTVQTTKSRLGVTVILGSSTSWTFDSQSDTTIADTDRIRIAIAVRTLNRQVTVSKLKLQYGDTATAWMQAVSDASANASLGTLTQTDVFNRLTNNGALQGLYMSGGQLYVNADYIKTGLLSANQIYGGKLQSNDGFSYFDLVNNLIRLGPNSTYGTTLESTGQIKSTMSSGTYFGTVSAGEQASGLIGQVVYLCFGNQVYGCIRGMSQTYSGTQLTNIEIVLLKYSKMTTIDAFYALSTANKYNLFSTDTNRAAVFSFSAGQFNFRSVDYGITFTISPTQLYLTNSAFTFTIDSSGTHFSKK